MPIPPANIMATVHASGRELSDRSRQMAQHQVAFTLALTLLETGRIKFMEAPVMISGQDATAVVGVLELPG